MLEYKDYEDVYQKNKIDLKDVNPIKFPAKNNNQIKSRLKSKILWGSIASIVVMLLGHLGLIRCVEQSKQ